MLPRMDNLVAWLQAAPIRDRALGLQDMYLDLHGRAAARAATFRILLYAASVALAGYVGYLFLRLRANARNLQVRLDLEKMIAEISAQFINLSRGRINDEIQDGLARVARAYRRGPRSHRRPGRRYVPHQEQLSVAAAGSAHEGLSP